MASPITCPAGDWTEIAPSGVDPVMIYFQGGALRIEYSVAKPTHPQAGIPITDAAVRAATLAAYPLRRPVAASIWARPDGGDASIIVSRLGI